MSPFGRIGMSLSLLLLATSGTVAWLVSHQSRALSSAPNLLDVPRHPVTEPMWQKAKAVAGKPGPNFQLKDPLGKAVQLSDLCKSGPVILVFTKDNCPCSIEAQPFFNQIAKGFEGKVTFVGIIDGPSYVASKFHDDFKVPYQMLLAEKGEVFKAYDAQQSAYTTLVDSKGIVIKQWPGYCRSMLVELDEEIAKLTGGKAVQIDTTMAPEKMNSGCAFAFD